MTKSFAGRRLAVAAVVAAAAIGSAAPAHAGGPDKCDGGVERLESRFREIEERRGYEAATKWWEQAWEKYYERCLQP